MDRFTLPQLRYFDALARQGNFSRAAEVCAISQPALSVQIKKLESMIGAPLVERMSREVRLTALGEEFLGRVRKVLADLDGMSDLMRAADGPLTGALRMGVIPTVAPYLLPGIMQTLPRRMSGLNLIPRESVTDTLVQDLLAGKLDFVVAALPISEPGLQEFPLFDEDFVLVRAAAEAALPVPDPQELQSMKLLLLEEGHCFRDQALSFCELGATPRSIVMEGSSLSTLVQMVGAGLGITFLPEMAIGLERHNAGIAIARFPPPGPRRSIGMAWRKSNPLGPKLMEVGAVIREVGRSQIAALAA